MVKHISLNGFVMNYTWWICHGEAHHARDEVVRQRIENYDVEARCGDMLIKHTSMKDLVMLGRVHLSQLQRPIMTCYPRHRNHWVSIPMFLNWMPSAA